jgi:aminoglycoside phosphotransferase (APT) family kinase protein
LRLAPCAGYLDKPQVLAFDWQPGSTLHALLSDPHATARDQRHALELTGAALAELHCQTPKGLEPRTRDAERDRLWSQAVTIGHLCPELRSLAERLARDLVALVGDTPHTPGALHGDFNAEQVLISSDNRATILDLDWAQLGDTAADLGLFIAHLERASQRGTVSRGQVEWNASVLADGYRAVKAPPPAALIHLYTAIGLFYLAAEPFRYRDPDWPEVIETLLVRAREILDQAGAVSKARV